MAQLIGPLGQIKRRRKVLDLCHREGDFHRLIAARVELFQRHAIVKSIDRHVFLQMRAALINQGDDGRVKLVFDGKHGCSLRWLPGFARADLRRSREVTELRLAKGGRAVTLGAGMLNGKTLLMRYVVVLCLLVLSACSAVPGLPDPTETAEIQPARVTLPSPEVAAENFVSVIDLVEPVAERICRAEAPGLACDYQIVVDNRPGQPANAFQTVDRAGRPIIAFTVGLIAEARNRDELAFILGHEAAHHIAGHLARQQETALQGAVLGGVLATLSGAGAGEVRRAQNIGASVGARAYSKDFELEADALGTVIAYRAGFDPLVGARYFERIDDPGNRFLGTHPPNAQRIETVRRVMAELR